MLPNHRVGFSLPSKVTLLSLVLVGQLYADNLDDMMEGFDEEPSTKTSSKAPQSQEEDIMAGFEDEMPTSKEIRKQRLLPQGLTGSLKEQLAFSYSGETPHNNISSLKSSLFLDYEHKFDNAYKFKTNAKAYYDAIYEIRGREKYSHDEKRELESEVELYDAYLEGSLSDKLDFKIGRQVVVWGRSDTIRITDTLNPIDNRRPAMVDIEDLRLPVAMAKLDYFVGDWRITPIAVLEQRFSKNPPQGTPFNPSPKAMPSDESYSDVTPALSIGGEFSGWDINLYASQTRSDVGYLADGKIQHDKVDMFGGAVNILYDAWLLKSEVAYLDGLKYTTTGDKSFKRTDVLMGLEYNGIADTLISYDIAGRFVGDYDKRLQEGLLPTKEHAYQHAFRVSSDFANATIKANYLLSLFGSDASEGGFQRAWITYDIADGINSNIGVVDYLGGSNYFDHIADNDMLFADVEYNF